MDLSAWVTYTFIAALIMAASLVHYRWREPEGNSRTVLAVLRGAALGLIVLLLFDPVVPTGAGGERPTVALMDASLSMSLPGEGGATRWDEARAVAGALEVDRIQLFGLGEGRTVTVTDLDALEPAGVGSQLFPALRAALEAGAGRVVVVTDGAVEDAPGVQRLAAGAGVPIDIRVVGEETRANVGIEGVMAPAWVEVGEEALVRVDVARVGEAGPALPDSGSVTLARGARELARAAVRIPAPGQTSTVELRFRPDSVVEGPVRLDLRVSPGGAAGEDDERSVYVRLTEAAAGVVLVSFSPDQEPRFLLPVLEQALGLPVRGWIGLRGDRFLRLGGGSAAGSVAPVSSVVAALDEASLLVLHGIGPESPAWALEALREAERVLVLPSDPPPELPVPVGRLQEGEWYLAPELPSSPVAPLLAGVDAAGLPPLTGLRPVELPGGYWTPLAARLGRRGEAYPVLVAGGESGRKMAVTLGTGYWRWAFAGPEGREIYERLWTALAGWLMEDLEGVERERIRPVTRVVGRGAPIRWIVAAPGDSLVVRMERVRGESSPVGSGDGDRMDVVMDTMMRVDEGRAEARAFPPGHYRYEARVGGGDAVRGPLTVESYSPELLHASRPLELASGVEEARARSGAGSGGGRPLHTAPWPYIVVVALLCAEWVLRRRWGLR